MNTSKRSRLLPVLVALLVAGCMILAVSTGICADSKGEREVGGVYWDTSGWYYQGLKKSAYMQCVSGADKNVAWTGGGPLSAIGAGAPEIWKATTSGNWSKQILPPMVPGTAVVSIDAVDRNVAWAVASCFNEYVVNSYSYILRTTNGGNTWQIKHDIYCNGPLGGLRDIDALDANTAWVVGGPQLINTRGMILKTTNGGNTWKRQNVGINAVHRAVSVVDANAAWVVGDSIQTGELIGSIRRTDNGGRTWIPQRLGSGENLFDISAVDGTTAWAVGKHRPSDIVEPLILKTTEGGSHWVVQAVEDPTPKTLVTVSAVDASTAWCGGEARVGKNWTVLKTVNGSDWRVQKVNKTYHRLYSISAVDSKTAWAVGACFKRKSSRIEHTKDGGDKIVRIRLPFAPQ